MSLSADETRRYARHLVLRDIGGAGQQALKSARVAVIGAGGLGSPVIAYLAAAGVGTIGVVDNDTVSLSNLQRQIVHRTEDVGTGKAANAGRFVAAMNPFVKVVPHDVRLDESNASEVLAGYELVIDGTDNFETRRVVALAAEGLGLPLVSGAVSMWDGQVTVF
jgi:molybdopterin/thiamine biosynthesis adenylyltransferase